MDYSRSDVAWFCSKDDPNWPLSNMAGGMPLFWPPQRKDIHRWNSSEALYQAAKYGPTVRCLPADADSKVGKVTEPIVRRRIQASANARSAKMTQKCAVAAGLVRDDWSSVRESVMLWVLETKLFFNRDTFGEALLATGDRVIVEVSSKDAFWGCLVGDDGRLHGENVLGRLLMSVRSRLVPIMRREWSHPAGFLIGTGGA